MIPLPPEHGRRPLRSGVPSTTTPAVLHSHVLDDQTVAVSGLPPLLLLERLSRALPPGTALVSDAEDVDALAEARELLSRQELAVVGLITSGVANAEVAARLGLTHNTVKSYVRAAYRKMGVRTRSEAVRWGLRHGLDRPSASGTSGDPAPPGRSDLHEPR